jgi:hypothetical protein
MNKKIILATILISVIAIFFNQFPNWYAWKNTPEGFVFSGQASWFDPWDINVYVSAIKWGQHQGFLLENLFTSQSNPPIFYYPLYTSLGMIFKNTKPFLFFHVFSIITNIFLVITLVIILKNIFKNSKIIFLTALLIILGGGLGFLVFPYYESVDTHFTSITLQSALQRPHEAVALASYCLALFGYYFCLDDYKKKKKWQIITSISLFLSLIFYPYYILSFWLISVMYLLTKHNWLEVLKQHKIFLATLITVSVSAVSLMAYNLSLNSSFSDVTSQQLSKPTISSFILGYGFLLLPVIYQLVAKGKKSNLMKFLLIWFLVAVSLLFLPVGFSRFFLRGTMIPLVILTVLTLKNLTKKYFTAQYPKIYFIFLSYCLILLSITSVIIFYHRLKEVKMNNSWYYFSSAQAVAFNFLDKQTPYLSGVLSSYEVGNLIPAHTRHRVYLGHLLQTSDANLRINMSNNFYQQTMTTNEAENFLKESHIKFVYFTKDESMNPSTWHTNYPFLTEVFNNQEVIIYQLEV